MVVDEFPHIFIGLYIRQISEKKAKWKTLKCAPRQSNKSKTIFPPVNEHHPQLSKKNKERLVPIIFPSKFSVWFLKTEQNKTNKHTPTNTHTHTHTHIQTGYKLKIQSSVVLIVVAA
jgi:hypothetical protein